MKAISANIRQWTKENNWYDTGVLTNEYKFNQEYGKDLKRLTIKLEFQGQNVIAGEIKEILNNLLKKCRKVDETCRAGCRNDDDLEELEFTRDRATSKLDELAELVEMVEDAQAETRNRSIDADEWITVAAAVVLLDVGKSTVSRWTDKKIIESNGKSGRDRRLLKSSVLMLKQQIEDGDRRKDDEDLRNDDPKFD